MACLRLAVPAVLALALTGCAPGAPDTDPGATRTVEPPAEIAEPWSVYLDDQERLQTEAEALPAGG